VLATQDPVSHNRTTLRTQPPEQLAYAPEHVAVIRKALVGVTQGGTSTRVFMGAPYLSGGKTGTAQAVTIGQKEKYNASKMLEHQRDHALYMAFAPADDPKIALAVVVEAVALVVMRLAQMVVLELYLLLIHQQIRI
jgi:penicillin-binding protein 2